MSQEGSANNLDFNVEPLTFFFQSLLAGLSLLIYKPAAEHWTKLLQMATEKMSFADGTKVTYSGKAATIEKPLLPVTIVIWAQILLGWMIDDAVVELAVRVGMALASGFVGYELLRVIAAQLVTNRGSRLEFSGTLEQYLKWQLILVGCSVLPAAIGMLLPESGLLGWLAWAGLGVLGFVLTALVILPYSQWFVSKVTGGTRVGRFEANPLEVVGTYVMFVLFSLLLVTIPWSVAWYLKWYLGRISLPARSGMAAGGYSV